MNTMKISRDEDVMSIVKSLPEKTRAEVINGELIFMGAPRLKHQQLVWDISVAMKTFVDANQLGIFIGFQCDVYLDKKSTVVQPDMMFISNANLYKLEDDGMNGAPDLVIEVLSPGNRRHDLIRKKDLYEKFGVGEYWIIDPDTKQATGYNLVDRRYQEVVILQAKLFIRQFEKVFSF